MPIVPHPIALAGGFSKVGANNSYGLLANSGDPNSATVESNEQITYRVAGTFNNLYMRITSNNTTSASSTTLRVNGTSKNNTLSIGTLATGEFLDTTHSDVIAAGDKVNVIFATGTGTIVRRVVSVTFNPGTATNIVRMMAGGVPSVVLAAATNTSNTPPAGALVFAATEANINFKAKNSGVLQNLFVNATANARTTTTTVRSRVAAANGNMSVSIGSAASGIFEDNVNTDTLVSGNLFNYRTVTGTGTQNLTVTQIGADYLATDPNFSVPIMCAGNVSGLASSTTLYVPFGGAISSNPTESQIQMQALSSCTISNMEAHVSANGVAAASTVRFRVSGGNGNQTFSIGSLATGYFEDASNTDIVGTSSEINYQFAMGTTTTAGSMSLNNIGAWLTFPALATNALVSWLPILGVG